MEKRTDSLVKLSTKVSSNASTEVNLPVMITAFVNDGAISAGRFVDLTLNDMRIKSKTDLEVGALLRLEVGDDLMMTEVQNCEPDEGEFTAGLLILSRLEKSELKRLRREAVTGPPIAC